MNDNSADPITLRAANPSIEDGLAFARYAELASEGFMSTLFGNRFREIMATAFIEPDHDMSYENTTFAEHNDVIAGMILCYTADRHRQSTRGALHRAAGTFRLRLRIIEVVLAPFMHLNDSIEAGDFYLQFIAVAEEGRTAGVGSVLLETFEKLARANGATRLSLDVSVSNDVARRFYENRGWRVDFEWPRTRLVPTLSLRMSKPLR